MQVSKDLHIHKEPQTQPTKESSIFKQSLLNWKNIIKFLIIPLVPLIILAIVSGDTNLWIVDGQDHFYFEMISVTLSFIVAYFCIMRGYAFRDKFSLFIGLGFHVGGMVDILHGAFAIINLGDTVFEGYFIPQTWVAGRIVMGLVLMIAIMKYKGWHEQKIVGSMLKLVIPYTLGLAAIAVVVVSISIYQPFPFIIIDFLIQRPYEMLGAVFFATALIFFFRNKLFENSDNFFKGIMVAILIDIFVNIIISYSSSVFDTAFNVAHTLKNVSLFIFIMALASSITQQYKIKNNLTDKLKSAYNELQEKFSTEQELADLKDVDRQKESFLSMITHELRTPLTPIIGYCEALERPKIMGKLEEKQYEAVNKIHANALRLRGILSDLLDAHKLEMNKMTFNLARFDVSTTLIDIIANLEIITKQKNIVMSTPVNDKLYLNSDKERIIQILHNLIFNAIDFVTKDTGKIELNVKQNRDFMIFSVSDNGCGIYENIKDKLFKKFYQADTSVTREHGGTGLGLSICQGLVEGLGGQIWVKNNHDKGSTFCFSIPTKESIDENISN